VAAANLQTKSLELQFLNDLHAAAGKAAAAEEPAAAAAVCN
jgi:hypothetical protein